MVVVVVVVGGSGSHEVVVVVVVAVGGGGWSHLGVRPVLGVFPPGGRPILGPVLVGKFFHLAVCSVSDRQRCTGARHEMASRRFL